MISWHEILLRLLAALAFSGAVGVQRYLVGKAAGVRTHILVGIGAALYTIISAYAFPTAAVNADRVASQVVTGIGFIGGGAILKESGTIKGLTTAAGLWAAAALGMAAGTGLYLLGAIGALVILGTLILLARIEFRLPHRMITTWLLRITPGEGIPVDAVRQIVEAGCPAITLEGLDYGDTVHLTFKADLPKHFDMDGLTDTLRNAGARQVSWQLLEIAGDDRGM